MEQDVSYSGNTLYDCFLCFLSFTGCFDVSCISESMGEGCSWACAAVMGDETEMHFQMEINDNRGAFLCETRRDIKGERCCWNVEPDTV